MMTSSRRERSARNTFLAAEAVAAVADLLLQVEAGPSTIRTELRDACFAVKEIPNRIL